MTRMSLAERRHRLIDAALRVIGEHGVAAATTRAIAAEAGMPLASFHYAFESHQNLMGEAMAAVMGDEMAAQRAWQPRGKSTSELFGSVLEAHLDDLVARTAVHRTVLELGDYALRTEGLTEVPREWRSRRAEQLAAQLDKQARQSGVRLPEQPEKLAQCLLVLTDGLTRAYLVTGDEALVRSIASTSATMSGLVAA